MTQVVFVAFFVDDSVELPINAVLEALSHIEIDEESGIDPDVIAADHPFTWDEINEFILEDEVLENEVGTGHGISRQRKSED